jgi:hypothetical protein
MSRLFHLAAVTIGALSGLSEPDDEDEVEYDLSGAG